VFALDQAAAAGRGAGPPMAAMPGEATKSRAEGDAKNGPSSGGAPVRVREFFPETLYFNPAIIADASGRAVLEIPMADSITTWRLTCMANSAAGKLGSTTAGLRVFQEFFVDVDFPVALTQNDEIDVPVAIYNYLKTPQDIRLKVTKEDWFDLKGDVEKTIRLTGDEVRAVYFPIAARKVGFQKFTVTARGSSRSDAVSREVEIVPDGKEVVTSFSGRLEGRVMHTIPVPRTAIDGASKVFVKIYPGTLSQVVEGLDKMLRMPSGCFEQTSSVTYPNILVLDFMKATGKVTPELQMKAEGFINSGYQRLLSFEVKGGGFEWFGGTPAHRILTAYGLMEFYDMSKVHAVDPAVIARTQQWLAGLQEADGSWKPAQGGIAEGAINKFTNDVYRTTAYITWALASTGYNGPQTEKGLAYLRQNSGDIKDVYTLALAANTFATVDPKSKDTDAVLRQLLAKKVEKDNVIYWPAGAETPTHGTGDCADIEVTGLAVQALVRARQEPAVISKAVTYLAKKRDAYGTWQSTQATIQALRGMLAAEREATDISDATVTVLHNGNKVQTIKIDKSNSDVLQLVDLKDRTVAGPNDVTLAFEGKGSMMYQVVGRCFMPYAKEIRPADEAVSIRVDYDRTQLAVEDILTATATVTSNRPGLAKMIIIDLGLPPGFTLLPDQLNRMVESKDIEKYSTTGRQVIIYLRELAQGKPVTVKYQLMAKYPLKAKTAKAVVYEYYNPDVRAETAPVELVVSKAAAANGK
jgi:alpha-2-macroglobulin-like protein